MSDLIRLLVWLTYRRVKRNLSARVVHVVSRKSPFIHTSAHSYELLSCLFIATAAGEEAAVSVKQNHS